MPVPGASCALGPEKTNASVRGTTASEDPSRPLPGLLGVAALACGAADEGKDFSPQHVRARLTQLQVGLPPLDTVADKAGFRNPYLHVLPRSPPAPRLRGCFFHV